MPRVDLGHGAAKAAKARFDGMQHGLVQNELAAQQLGHGFAGQVVQGGSESAGGNDQLDAAEGLAEGVANVLVLVADHGLASHLDAEMVEALCKQKGIGVHAIRRKQFRADCNDFSFHECGYRGSGKPSTSQSMLKSALVVVSTARRVGSSARPTSPMPLRTTSACPSGVIRTMPRCPPLEAAT